MVGAISQDRESCQFPFLVDENPLLYQAARPESGREAREVFLMAARVGNRFRLSDCLELIKDNPQTKELHFT